MSEPQKITLGLNPESTEKIPLENIPIRTMKDDLKSASMPNFNPSEEPAMAKMASTASPSPATIKPASSPFLTPKQAIIPKSVETSSATPAINPFQRTINPLATQGNVNISAAPPETSLNLKKIFFIGSGIFLMLAMMAGGYYYWITRQSKKVATQPEPLVEQETVPVTIPEPEPEIPPVVAPVFSIDKPNYLIVDIQTDDIEDIKSKIKERAAKIIADVNIKTPIEFIISDGNFAPASFKYFAGILKLNLSTKLIANLEDKFSLFIYNDNGIAKLGLILDTKDEALAKTQMTQAENLLITQLNPLFMDMPYTVKDKKFSSGQYEDLVIRYNNLISASELSLDYAFSNKKLFIGTSKMTLRSIYDYLKSTIAKVTVSETAQPVDNLSE